LRLELRDQIPLQLSSLHFFGVRIGLAFR
jgi:hypothetical protein